MNNQTTNPYSNRTEGYQRPENNSQNASHPSSIRPRPQGYKAQSRNSYSDNQRPVINARGNLNHRGRNISTTPHWLNNNWQNNTQSTTFCNICKRRGHTESNCERRHKCDYCHRSGHTTQDCRTHKHEERQEHFFRSLISEQTQQNNLLFQSFQRYLPINQLNQTPTGPGASSWPSQAIHQVVNPSLSQQYQPLGQIQQHHPPVIRQS